MSTCPHCFWRSASFLFSGLLLATTANVAKAQSAPVTSKQFFNVVTYVVPHQNFATFFEQSRINALATRQEAGVLSFQVVQSNGQPDTIMFIEQYKDQAAAESHRKTAHFLTFMTAVKQSGATRTAFMGNSVLLSK